MPYDNTNKGILGKNNRKTKDTHPPYSGQINIDGVEYWLSAWVNKKKDSDERFFSITAKRKEPKSDAKPPASAPDDDSEIPF
jgi:hypothetical protein